MNVKILEGLTVREKADLFDALFMQEKIEVVSVEELGNPDYQHLQIKFWTKHLASETSENKLKTEIAQKTLMQYLDTHLNSL